MAESEKDVSQEITNEISKFLNDPVNYTPEIELDVTEDMLKKIFTEKIKLGIITVTENMCSMEIKNYSHHGFFFNEFFNKFRDEVGESILKDKDKGKDPTLTDLKEYIKENKNLTFLTVKKATDDYDTIDVKYAYYTIDRCLYLSLELKTLYENLKIQIRRLEEANTTIDDEITTLKQELDAKTNELTKIHQDNSWIKRKFTDRTNYNVSKDSLKQRIEVINNQIIEKQSLLTKNRKTLVSLKKQLSEGIPLLIPEDKLFDKTNTVKITLDDVLNTCSGVPATSSGGNRNKLRLSKLKKIHTKKSRKRRTKKSRKY